MNSLVSIRRCPNYQKKFVSDALSQVLKDMGGIQRFVKSGQTVLLKPNMLSAKAPDQGVTTHPVFLEILTEEICNAGGEVWIGDSPSGGVLGIHGFWEKTGYLDVADNMGVRLINFEADGTIQKKVNGRTYYIAKSVFEADVIINLPKFKTHGFTLYTGALKNLYGTLPGFQKTILHKNFPRPDVFSEILCDLNSLIKPPLHIMDGIIGMEGDGPASGSLRSVNLILASRDPVALDAVASHIMGFGEDEIDAVRIASEKNLGEKRLFNIAIRGESITSIKIPDYSLPSNRLVKLIPQFLMRWFGRFIWVRPQVNERKCTYCGICVQNCPVDAIQMNGIPVMNYKTCINCLCCNECCPEGAILQKMSWLARRFS
jgi:uncharacterized protein (DUF362 family)/Pyruvate/2-oxoacid:ferredoxin oxidoreductase delta subunit